VSVPVSKPCVSCGRAITWRKAWSRDWDQVRHCSNACRKRKLRTVDHELEAVILRLLDARSRDGSICPSEAARAVAAGASPQAPDAAWRALMEPARRAARRLVARGEVEITQQGRVVDPSSAKGPIRLRRAR
jgi:hypothetical protein